MAMEIVNTRWGKVSGVAAKGEKYAGVMCFNSIPYAAPPVGTLRFRPPQDPLPWEGVRDCAGYGNRPWQNMQPGVEPYASDFFYKEDVPPMSEDCLYLSSKVLCHHSCLAGCYNKNICPPADPCKVL